MLSAAILNISHLGWVGTISPAQGTVNVSDEGEMSRASQDRNAEQDRPVQFTPGLSVPCMIPSHYGLLGSPFLDYGTPQLLITIIALSR